MNRQKLTVEDLRGVFAVPPLARRPYGGRLLDPEQNYLIRARIALGGIKRLIYGGNAFVYHQTLKDWVKTIEWLQSVPEDTIVVPSIGPAFGTALEQADLLRSHGFSTAMVLPCGDPRDAAGLERGYRELAYTLSGNLIVYLKDEHNFGSQPYAGLDAVARLVDDGFCVGIKYAVVRENPADDPYLEGLLERVDRKHVISGIGERPAIVHLRDWKLSGFTTGSGCIAPDLSQLLFEALQREDYEAADALRKHFIPLEDLRDGWGPARVLHHATELAGIARTGPIIPYVSPLDPENLKLLESVAQELALKSNEVCRAMMPNL